MNISLSLNDVFFSSLPREIKTGGISLMQLCIPCVQVPSSHIFTMTLATATARHAT